MHEPLRSISYRGFIHVLYALWLQMLALMIGNHWCFRLSFLLSNMRLCFQRFASFASSHSLQFNLKMKNIKIMTKKNPPRRGIEPRSPAWQAGILTTILPRIADISSHLLHLNLHLFVKYLLTETMVRCRIQRIKINDLFFFVCYCYVASFRE